MAAAVHVPAWQKLGLKLKKPQSNTSSPSASVKENNENGSASPSRKRQLDTADVSEDQWPSQRLSKRPKKDSSASELILNSVTELNKQVAKQLPQSDESVNGTRHQKRKSVSFGPEVKADDGDSVRFFKKQKKQEQDAKASVSSSWPGDSQSEEMDLKVKSKSKKKKKKKKTKTKNQQDGGKAAEANGESKVKDAAVTSDQIPSYLTYLSTYHSSRTDWKFSKSLQNTLLKKLFDVEEVPSSYDTALLSYLEGLQGDNAKNRLRDRALEIRKSDADWLEDPPLKESQGQGKEGEDGMSTQTDPDRARRQKEAYEGCIARLRSQLRDKAHEREEQEWERCGEKEAWEQRWRKRKRAEVVLWCVGETAPVPPSPPPLPPAKPDPSCYVHPSRQQRNVEEEPQAAADNSWMWGRDARRIDSSVAGQTGKKVTFGDDGVAVKTEAGGVNGASATRQSQSGPKAGGTNGNAGPAGKKKRTRRGKKRTGVPDDDDSSSSSDSDSEVEAKKEVVNPKKTNGVKLEAKDVKRQGSDSSSFDSSDSSSDSSDDDDDDDDSSSSDSD